jgi:hypothetical protein
MHDIRKWGRALVDAERQQAAEVGGQECDDVRARVELK